ncbi:MAG TPA: methyltransferase [Burkholderiales bacterium]
MAQDSSRPEFWDTRYRGGVTPWDAAGVPGRLEEFLENLRSSKVLIPGCGAGYEVKAFAERGHDVLAIEFSDAAIEAAQRALGPLADRVRKADFFAFDAAPFDLVYERAFLCALPRRRWPQWAKRVAELLRPAGRLAGFFYLDDNERGPPFGISREKLDDLLAGFQREDDRPVPESESIPVFKGKEVWQVWTRPL